MFIEKFNSYKKKIKKLKAKEEFFLLLKTFVLFSILFLIIISIISIIYLNTKIFYEGIDYYLILLSIILKIVSFTAIFNIKNISKKIDRIFINKENKIKHELESLDDFNLEEIFENLKTFYTLKDIKVLIVKHIQKNELLLIENLKYICEKTNYYEWLFIIEIKNKKKLLLSEDMEWYSKQVSQTKLYQYFKEDIENIIKNKEKEYYHVIKNLFSNYLEESLLIEIENLINIEKSVLIIKI